MVGKGNGMECKAKSKGKSKARKKARQKTGI
jgi:hypothetical protein